MSDNHLTNLILKRPRLGSRKHILIHNGKSQGMSVLHLQITGKGIDSRKRTGLAWTFLNAEVFFILFFSVPSIPATGRDLYSF